MRIVIHCVGDDGYWIDPPEVSIVANEQEALVYAMAAANRHDTFVDVSCDGRPFTSCKPGEIATVYPEFYLRRC
jgi:hypothetical protein